MTDVAIEPTKVGSEFRVNTETKGPQLFEKIASLEGGGFVVVWQTGDSAQDGSGTAIKAQIYDAQGAKWGGEFLVNSAGLGNQNVPSVSSLEGGGFVVVWQTGDSAQDGSNSAIKAQIFDASGTKVGTEFLVNSEAFDFQSAPTVSELANGGFVITWVSRDASQDGSSTAIKMQIFDSAGAKVGSEILVNTITLDAQSNPDVAALADGGFVIT